MVAGRRLNPHGGGFAARIAIFGQEDYFMSRPFSGWIFAAAGLIVWCGCGCSRFPPAPEKPDIDPAEAGEAAIDQYDTNGDGQLDGEEVEKCAPLKNEDVFKRIDADGDGKLTAKEIAARIEAYLSSGSTIVTGTTLVKMDGKALKGATVIFEPEEFLGTAFKPCEGITDEQGYASLKGPNQQYPGIYLGLYRVKITKPGLKIPSRYNTDTELAYEAADDVGGVGSIEFHLKSK